MKAVYAPVGHTVGSFDLGKICLHSECASITALSFVEEPLFSAPGAVIDLSLKNTFWDNIDDGLYFKP